MKKEYLQYKHVIEISWNLKDYLEQAALCRKVVKYLELEFGLIVKKKSETKKGLILCVDEDFDESIAEYILTFIHPDSLSIFHNV